MKHNTNSSQEMKIKHAQIPKINWDYPFMPPNPRFIELRS